MIIIDVYICVTYFVWSTPPRTFNNSAAGCGDFPIEVNNRVTSQIALYVHLIIRCCNHMVFCTPKDALSKYNNTVLVFCDRASLIKNPTECAYQQYYFHSVLPMVRRKRTRSHYASRLKEPGPQGFYPPHFCNWRVSLAVDSGARCNESMRTGFECLCQAL